MYARFSHSFDGTIRAIAVAYAFVVAIIVANVIVAADKWTRAFKYKFNPGKSIERSARSHF